MPLIIALLKINVTLAVCYLLYYLLFRKLSFYNLNRAFFLATLGLSASMPFIDIRLKNPVAAQTIILDMGRNYPVQPAVTDTIDFAGIAGLLFWTGVAFMGLRLLLRLGAIGSLYLRSRKMVLQGTPLRILDHQSGPFSFFKSIFLNPGRFSETELHMIIRHEKVHAQQGHSFDILLGEINKAFCWFNPAAWLLANAIRQNLEFIADREILQNGIEARTYQYSLLRVSQQEQTAVLTSNFNFSHLKTRIIMMNKQQSASIHLMKYLTAAPLILALVCCFGVSSGQQKKIFITTAAPHEKKVSNKQVTNPVVSAKPEVTLATADPKMLKKALHKENNREEQESVATVAEVVEPGTDADEITIQSASGTQVVQIKEGALWESLNRPVVVVDGQKVPYETLDRINADHMKSMTVLKGLDAVALFGEEGKNGAILITMKEQ